MEKSVIVMQMPGKHYSFLRTVVVVYYRPNKVSLQIIIMGGERVISLFFAFFRLYSEGLTSINGTSHSTKYHCRMFVLMVFVSEYLIEFTLVIMD